MKKYQTMMTLGLLGLSMFMGGCASNSHKPQAPTISTLNQQDNDAAAQFNYLLQFAGGRYQDPALQEYLTVTGKRLLKLSGYQQLAAEFVVIDSQLPSAWVSPQGHIAISWGMMLGLKNEAELAALIGHLLAHAGQKHLYKVIERGDPLDPMTLQQAGAHPDAQYVVEAAKDALIAHSAIYTLADELKADKAAITMMVKAGYDPQAAIDLQLRALDQQRSKPTLWLRNHATNQERVGANRQASFGHPSSLLMAQHSYDKAMAPLRKEQPAYQQLQQASRQLQGGDAKGAYQQIRQVLTTLPRVATVYALEGDALAALGETDNAIHAYSQAITRAPDYYAHYLRRAELYLAKKQLQQAEADLVISLKRLPTAKGYLLLAQLLEQRGDQQQAHRFYQRAALSDLPLGSQAEREAKRVDFASNPDRYIHIKPTLEEDGSVALFITNLNPFPVRLQSMLLYAGQTYRLKLDKTIPGGSSLTSKITIKNLQKIEKVSVDKAQLVQ